MGHGFHEDGLVSAMRVAEALGAPARWVEATDSEAKPVHIGVRRPLVIPTLDDGIPAVSG
jgi:predicted NAD/FAD-binding protein